MRGGLQWSTAFGRRCVISMPGAGIRSAPKVLMPGHVFADNPAGAAELDAQRPAAGELQRPHSQEAA